MEALAGKKIFVAGGAGEVGEGIVRGLLAHGADHVITSSRSADKLAHLQDRLADVAGTRLSTYTANIGIISDAQQVLKHIQQEHGTIQAVIATLGGWWQGQALTDLTLSTWYRLLDNNLTAHLVVARTFLPVIATQEGSSYTMINGGAAEQAIPLAGPISILAAAQLMMKDVLVKEWAAQPVRINTLLLATPIISRSRPTGEPHWLTAEDVGTYAAYLISERAAGVRGETLRLTQRAQVEQIQP